MVVKKRINGSWLAQNIGQQIILLGTISKRGSSGSNIELITTDGVQVNVTLPEPISDNVNGYLEIHGTLQSKNTMSCTKFAHFPSTMTENFDTNQYNELVLILNILGQRKWKINDN